MVAGDPLPLKKAAMMDGDRALTSVGHWRFFQAAGPPNASMVEEACRRLRLFAFVGLTEHWLASACLFHAQFWASGSGPGRVDVLNVLPGAYRAEGYATREADCGDTADEQLFACGAALFAERLARHPRCVGLLRGGQSGLEELRRLGCACVH